LRAKFAQRSNGAALAELALVLPLCSVLIAALLTFGNVFSQAGVLANAAREGARYGSTHPTDVYGIRARVVQEAAGSGVSIQSNNVAVSTPTGSGIGNPIAVRVNHQFSTVMPSFLGLTNVLGVSRDCTMVIN
jgi:Flp pilus assembly protein TadG